MGMTFSASGWRVLARHAWILTMFAGTACESEPALSEWTIRQSVEPAQQCERPARKKVGADEEIVLETARAFCDIAAMPVVTLRPSPDESYPDPGVQAVITRDGRYVTTSRSGHQILEWSADGRFLRAIGR